MIYFYVFVSLAGLLIVIVVSFWAGRMWERDSAPLAEVETDTGWPIPAESVLSKARSAELAARYERLVGSELPARNAQLGRGRDDRPGGDLPLLEVRGHKDPGQVT